LKKKIISIKNNRMKKVKRKTFTYLRNAITFLFYWQEPKQEKVVTKLSFEPVPS